LSIGSDSVSDGEDFTIEDLNAECNAVLLPEYDEDNYAEVLLEDFYQDIFELELSSWTTEDSQWSKNRNYDEFLKWFEVELHSIVFDSLDKVIEKNLTTIISLISSRDSLFFYFNTPSSQESPLLRLLWDSVCRHPALKSVCAYRSVSFTWLAAVLVDSVTHSSLYSTENGSKSR